MTIKLLLGVPLSIGMLAQVGTKVARVAGNFLANPWGYINWLIFAREFDLRQDKPLVVAVKFVHFPALTTVLDDVARLLDEWPKAKVHQLLSVVERNGILKLRST